MQRPFGGIDDAKGFPPIRPFRAYSQERIFETFYSWKLNQWTALTFDYQFISNPAYNADRRAGLDLIEPAARRVLIRTARRSIKILFYEFVKS